MENSKFIKKTIHKDFRQDLNALKIGQIIQKYWPLNSKEDFT